MKLIKTAGTPGPILRAIMASQEEYGKGVGEFLQSFKGSYDYAISVTSLPLSPRQFQLGKRYSKDAEIEPKSRYFVLLGSITHYIMETFPDEGDIIERRSGRIFRIGGKRVLVHGAADVMNFDLEYIKDYKFASTSSMQYPKEAYIAQLNILRYLQPKEERDKIKKLNNIFIFRDWTNRDQYSEFPWKEVEQPLWLDEQCAAYLKVRLEEHIKYFECDDDLIPECSAEERWERKSGFQIFPYTKAGTLYKKSMGFASSEEEAHTFAESKNMEKYELKPRAGVSLKCQKFCDIKDFCSQYKNKIKQEETQDEDS